MQAISISENDLRVRSNEPMIDSPDNSIGLMHSYVAFESKFQFNIFFPCDWAFIHVT